MRPFNKLIKPLLHKSFLVVPGCEHILIKQRLIYGRGTLSRLFFGRNKSGSKWARERERSVFFPCSHEGVAGSAFLIYQGIALALLASAAIDMCILAGAIPNLFSSRAHFWCECARQRCRLNEAQHENAESGEAKGKWKVCSKLIARLTISFLFHIFAAFIRNYQIAALFNLYNSVRVQK